MMKYGEIYKKLKKDYSKKEIAESMMVSEELTTMEASKLSNEMKSIRFQKLSETSDRDKIMSDVVRLRFIIEEYVNRKEFSFEKTFGKYLEEYIRIIKKSRKEVAEDLSIHYTKLSRIINDKEEPNVELAYRLEKHSGNTILVELWWKLMIKKQEFIISKDEDTRQAEYNKVKNPLRA